MMPEVKVISERTGSTSETDMTWHYVTVDGEKVSMHFFKFMARFKAWRLRRRVW
jgi:hypothetical protein